MCHLDEENLRLKVAMCNDLGQGYHQDTEWLGDFS